MKVDWTTGATRNLREARAFIARDNPSAADRTAQRIRKAARMLADFPLLGRSAGRGASRELVVSGTPYLLVYRVRGELVEVLRVMHGAQSPEMEG